MKYAKEVIDLLASYPGRQFRMAEIVRHVSRGRALQPREAEAVRKAVRRVLDVMAEQGLAEVQRSAYGRGSYSLYGWKVGHQVLKSGTKTGTILVPQLRP